MTRPSQTAVSVARALLYLDRCPKTAKLLPTGAAEMTRRLLGTVGTATAMAERLWSVRVFRRGARFVEGRIMPGFVLHLGLRKRFFDDEVRASLATGIKQVVVLGAGFDSLATRLALVFPHVSFIEVDHPRMSTIKGRALQQLGLGAENLHIVPALLDDTSWAEALAACPFWERSTPSCVLAEGLLMYLDAPAARALLSAAGQLPGGSRLVFSYICKRADGGLDLGSWSRIKDLAFSLLGERLRWGIPAGGLDGELAAHGLRRRREPRDYDLCARYLAPAGLETLPIARVERVCVAEAGRG